MFNATLTLARHCRLHPDHRRGGRRQRADQRAHPRGESGAAGESSTRSRPAIARPCRAIFDANVTNVIAAALMFYFGSGPVRGFAVVLMIGIVTSVFTAVNFTRMLVALWIRRARPREIAYLRLSSHEAAEARPRPHQHRLHALAQSRADPVDPRHRRLDLLHGLSRAQPRHRLRRRPGHPRRPSRSRSHIERLRSRGRRAAARRSQHPGSSAIDRTYQIRLPKPAGRDTASPTRRQPGRAAAITQRISRRRSTPVDTVSGKVSEELAADSAHGDRPRDARHRHLHLVPLRMAVRGRRAADARPRRRDDPGLLLVHPARRSTSTSSRRS